MLLPLLINLKMVGSDPKQNAMDQSAEQFVYGGGNKRSVLNKQNREEEPILIEILKFWAKWQN